MCPRRLRRWVGGRCRYHRSMPVILGCPTLARRCTRRSILRSPLGLLQARLGRYTPISSRQQSCTISGSSICWQQRLQFRRLSSVPGSAGLSMSTSGSSASLPAAVSPRPKPISMERRTQPATPLLAPALLPRGLRCARRGPRCDWARAVQTAECFPTISRDDMGGEG